MLDLIGPTRGEPVGSRAERSLLALSCMVGALAGAAVWGIAAGSDGGHLALRNALIVPMLVLLSTLVALPLVLLVLRLLAPGPRMRDLVLLHAASQFAGAAVLLLISPLLLLYQLSSAWAGPVIGESSAVLAFLVACAVAVRVARKLASREVLLPMVLLAVLQLAALAQLAAMAPPVFANRTWFGKGVDGALRGAAVPSSGPASPAPGDAP